MRKTTFYLVLEKIAGGTKCFDNSAINRAALWWMGSDRTGNPEGQFSPVVSQLIAQKYSTRPGPKVPDQFTKNHSTQDSCVVPHRSTN